MVVADYDLAARRAHGRGSGGRRRAVSDRFAPPGSTPPTPTRWPPWLARPTGSPTCFNAVDPRFVLPIFTGALAAGADYLDMAMSLSRPPPGAALQRGRRQARRRAVRPGRAVGAGRDGSRWSASGSSRAVRRVRALRRRPPVRRHRRARHPRRRQPRGPRRDGNEVFAPGFSIWTTIEECLNPPVVWERTRSGRLGWFYTLPPFTEPEVFDFPEGIGPVECVHVEHEEVLLMPRWVERRTGHLQVRPGRGVHRRPADAAHARPGPHRAGAGEGRAVSPRDVVAACCPTRRRSGRG